MKRIIYIISILMFFTQCQGQCQNRGQEQENLSKSNKPIGIGLLTVNTEFPIPLYKSVNDTIPFETIEFKINRKGVTKFITKLDLNPYFMYEGDSYEESRGRRNMGLVGLAPELKFRVIDSTETTFTVITNEIKNTAFIIKIDPKGVYYKSPHEFYENNCINCPGSVYNPKYYTFETWERYLKRLEYIEKDNLQIYDKPNGNIIFENKNNDFLPFNIVEVEGDWIKLKKASGRESYFDENQNYDGWTQWKDGNTILIQIVEVTYE